MSKWRVYKHRFRFVHNVEDNANLVDKSCLTPHKHGFGTQQPCTMEIIVKSPHDWVDFKEIKQVSIKAIESLANKFSEVDMLPFYDFGTQDTENLTDDVKKLVQAELSKKYKDTVVQIWLDETNKYSIWDDGLDDTPKASDCSHDTASCECIVDTMPPKKLLQDD